MKYQHWQFHLRSDQKKEWRSQHVKEQAGSEPKVNQVPTTQEEDRTEVLQEEEEGAIIKPAAEGTGIPYETRPSQSTIKTTLPQPWPPQLYPWNLH